ncbi:cation:proton antiporter [Candidatus Woesearchaeota archaeon]|nr:cation:proton antiporter [Candidatus Woesearchaeota archaeon]
MDVIAVLTIILGIAFIFGEIFHRLGLPRIVGQIIAGILIALTPLSGLITGNVSAALDMLSKMAIVFLLLLAGMELNLKKFESSIGKTIILSIFTTIIPLILGVIVGRILGYDWLLSILLGGALAVTAEGTTTTVLISEKALNTKIGTYIIGAGIVDDVVEVILVSIVSIMVAEATEIQFLSGIPHTSLFPLFIILFIVLVFLIVKLIPVILRYVSKERSTIASFSAVVIVTFLLAALSNTLSFGYAIGAFLAGIIIQKANLSRPEEEKQLEEELKVFTLGFIIPFFFVNIGLHFNIEGILYNPLIFLLVLGAGILGKMLGSLIAHPFLDVSLAQANLIGWAMNARGAIELVVIEILRQHSLITSPLYSSIVAMTVISSLLFPVAIKIYKKHDPRIMI